MITKTDSRGVQNGKELVRLAFKSTDSKPTAGIMNGSTGIEVNTGKQYVYDEESGEWTEIASSGGGGGGGGSSDFSTAEVTIINNSELYYDGAGCFEREEITGFLPKPASSVPSCTVNPQETQVCNMILYKGRTELALADDNGDEPNATTTGDITYSAGIFIITGNGTITIS